MQLSRSGGALPRFSSALPVTLEAFIDNGFIIQSGGSYSWISECVHDNMYVCFCLFCLFVSLLLCAAHT